MKQSAIATIKDPARSGHLTQWYKLNNFHFIRLIQNLNAGVLVLHLYKKSIKIVNKTYKKQ